MQDEPDGRRPVEPAARRRSRRRPRPRPALPDGGPPVRDDVRHLRPPRAGARRHERPGPRRRARRPLRRADRRSRDRPRPPCSRRSTPRSARWRATCRWRRSARATASPSSTSSSRSPAATPARAGRPGPSATSPGCCAPTCPPTTRSPPTPTGSTPCPPPACAGYLTGSIDAVLRVPADVPGGSPLPRRRLQDQPPRHLRRAPHAVALPAGVDARRDDGRPLPVAAAPLLRGAAPLPALAAPRLRPGRAPRRRPLPVPARDGRARAPRRSTASRSASCRGARRPRSSSRSSDLLAGS